MYLNLIMYILANHDQNIQSRFRLLKVCLFVKLESSDCKIYLSKSTRLDRSKIRLDQSSLVQIIFLQKYSTQTQIHALSIKGKSLAMFYSCCLCYVYESLVRSRGVCLHTYLELSRSRLMLKAWWSFQLLHKELKKNTSGSTYGCYESKKEVVRGLGAVTWSW